MRRLLPWIALAAVAVVIASLAWRDPAPLELELAPDAATTSADARELELATDDPAPDRVVAPVAIEVAAEDARRVETIDGLARFLPQSTGALIVRVVDAGTGRPIAGANVQPLHATGIESGELARTDDEGEARFGDLHGRVWHVSADARGYAGARGSTDRGEPGPEVRLELRLERVHTLVARVVDSRGRELTPASSGLDAECLHGVGLVATIACAVAGSRAGDLATIPVRARRIDASAGVAWEVEVRGEPTCLNATLGDVVLASSPVGAWSPELVLALDDATLGRLVAPLAVRVLGARTELPLVGAGVALVRGDKELDAATTDAEGRARFDAVCGDVVARVRAPGHAAAEIALRRPFERELVLRLEVARRIEGRMVDQTGAPMPRAKVALYAAEEAGSGRPAQLLQVVTTDVRGAFDVKDLAPGQYAVGTHSGTGYPSLPRVSDWRADALVLADCRESDARGVELRGFRAQNDVAGEDWNPPPAPRR